MLELREADLPVLLLVLVVLPLVTYVLLGIWSESGKKNARIDMLAQLAAEEAQKVEYVTPVNVTPTLPSSKFFYQCAKCFAPATTRCSKCKSVRYCSGKCQIKHWRLGHKQECQQLAISRSLSLSADSMQFRPLENSKQVLGNVISEPLHGDFLSDVPDDTSLATRDLSYDIASERKLPDSDKRIRSRSKKETRSNGVAACAFEDTVITGVDSPWGHELGNGSFTTFFEVKRSHDSSSTLKNLTCQTNKIKGETRNMNKLSCAVENSVNRVNAHEAGTIFSSEGELFSSNEALELNLSAEDTSIRESVMYKRPPYILVSATPLYQKSAEQIPRECLSQGMEGNVSVDDESRVSAAHLSTNVSNIRGPQLSGSKKSSNVHKKNPSGLIHDFCKNKMLFPYEDLVKYFRCELWGISPRGLLNCGNSCYANAVLQCLTCTKPLMVYLLWRSHSRTCRVRDWCLMCELEQHLSMLQEGGGPLSPGRLLLNMRNIGCRMGGGNQEDAHEFLRLLLMSMQSICLEGFGGEKEVHPRLQETTLIQQIFGGRLKSKVKCLRCHHESERYENIMDLTLEIHGWVESLEDALTQFTAPEDLDGENMYRCGRCATYVKARKQLSVNEVPNILTIVLKRFQSGKYGKINKCVTFPDILDMIPFVTGDADIPPLYMLYGVVVHLDTLNASFSGHYVSYVKDMHGTWLRIDDSEMHPVSLSEVMSEGAYMLFYSRSFPRPPRLYMENERASVHAVPKNEKNSGSGAKNIRPRKEKYSDSDATSSDWSPRFTSSDESSFTTESTRDSFSTVDLVYKDLAM